jgi:hypothetical protein
MNSVVVIGAGLAGLSAACYLTGRGYDVTVVERDQLPGGRAGVVHRDGFTFDSGPTVLTMPDLIADTIRAATRDPSASLGELLPMRRLDPAYRACYADGSTINVRYGREAMREEIAQTCGSVDAAAFDMYVDWLRQLFVVEMPHFIDRNYDSPLGLLSSPGAVAQLVRLGAFGRLGTAIRRRFADPRLHRLPNFIRDIDEDLDRGRVYLPQDDLQLFDVDLGRRTVTPEWRAFLAYEIERNRALYSFADTGIAMLPPRSARCVATARVLYAQILDEIERNGYDVFSQRARVPTPRKAATAARIMVTGPRSLKRRAQLYQRRSMTDVTQDTY